MAIMTGLKKKVTGRPGKRTNPGQEMKRHIDVRAEKVENGFIVTDTDAEYNRTQYIAQNAAEANELLDKLAKI